MAKRGPYKQHEADKTGLGGIRLRQHRIAKNWSVADLAHKAKVSPGTVSGIESGEGYSGDMLLSLAKALGTTVDALFSIDPRPGKAGTLFGIYSHASPHVRQRIEDFANGAKDDDER